MINNNSLNILYIDYLFYFNDTSDFINDVFFILLNSNNFSILNFLFFFLTFLSFEIIFFFFI
jgi:hypothetical protein